MKFYVNARYLIVPFMSLIAIASILIGGSFAWVGVALFGLNTIIDTLTKNMLTLMRLASLMESKVFSTQSCF